jgi:hypothetical protein
MTKQLSAESENAFAGYTTGLKNLAEIKSRKALQSCKGDKTLTGE